MIALEITKLIKVGSSLGVIVPIEILRALRIERGDHVAFSVAEGDVICIRKISETEKLQIKPHTIKI